MDRALDTRPCTSEPPVFRQVQVAQTVPSKANLLGATRVDCRDSLLGHLSDTFIRHFWSLDAFDGSGSMMLHEAWDFPETDAEHH